MQIVIYHANCWDGLAAAWLMSKVHPDATFIPIHYGQDFIVDVQDCNVRILDFCFPLEVFEKCFFKQVKSLLILDHHKTAEPIIKQLNSLTLNKNIVGYFDNTKSGCMLTYNYLSKIINLGKYYWLIQYIQDRDLWTWALPHSKEINAAIGSYPRLFETLDSLAESSPETLKLEGSVILRQEQLLIDNHCKHARLINIGGYQVPITNATTLFSEIAGKLAEGYPFGVCYFDRFDGKRQFSLRSTKDGIDVSEIAKKYGGGGHFHAAGFELTYPYSLEL